jgi:hypothetical protein
VTPTTWANRFEKRCRELQVALGLTDWNFIYERKKGDGTMSAEVNMHATAREAVFTIYMFKQTDSPERIAFHEVLHVLYYETLKAAAHYRSYRHKRVALEEHRSIERLVNFFCGQP